MIFDVYKAHKTRDGRIRPGVRPTPMEWDAIKREVLASDEVRQKVTAYRQGDGESKQQLPAICFVGRSTGMRRACDMVPTQLVMVDIDHCPEPRKAWEVFCGRTGREWLVDNVMVAHVTPSGRGLHIFFLAQPGLQTLKDNMDWIRERYQMDQLGGDFDDKVQDFARISFAFPTEDLLFENARLLLNTEQQLEERLKNPAYGTGDSDGPAGTAMGSGKKADAGVPELTEEEMKEYEALDYRGTQVKLIIDKYVETYGKPSGGEVHNYYNELVKNFRCITSNNRKALLYLLPRFGHTEEECWGQINSICRVNTLSSLEKPFYFFLKDNGFYPPREGAKTPQSRLQEYMMSEEDDAQYVAPPFLPPVIRDLVQTAPQDFVYPTVNALLPMMGTLTSYLGAVYPYDGRVHTTSFFSVIYAPPGTGKGFVERFSDLLMGDLKLRDRVQSRREEIYLRAMNRKGDNERSPENPQTSLRIMPPKNSEAEFLEKQRNNKGYHMFTYASEMDSWAKGAKAAGGNKDDMIRVAWDNGLYGQQFKSTATFKGSVNLYWNVLICGTLNQLESYFKNIENGLVQRCSFFSIDNQEYQKAPKWKPLTQRSLETIRRFVSRCDENTYEQPCTLNAEELETISDEDFDKEVDWRFKFRQRQMVDCSWVMPTIDRFHDEQIRIASMNVDKARDVFRRRVGVRGFRIAILCMALYPNMNKKQQKECAAFIDWWMHRDLEATLRLWGDKYNNQASDAPHLTQRMVFEKLGKEFTKNDVYAVCVKQGIKTPIKNIIYNWKKNNIIKKTAAGSYKKI